MINKMIGIIPNTNESINEVKSLRKKLSREKFNLDEINKLAD